MNPTHFLLRIGDGQHFKNSSSKSIWGINSKNSFGKWFIRTAKEGDLLWFVTGKSNGQIVAVATFKGTKTKNANDINNILDKLGANYNASKSYCWTRSGKGDISPGLGDDVALITEVTISASSP